MRLVSGLLLTTFAASAAPDPFNCPARGGREWHEVKSAHFVIDTDATGQTLAVLVRNLEDYQAKELSTVIGGAADLPGHIRVVAFSNQAEFAGLAGRFTGGFYSRSDLYGPFVALPIEGFTADAEVIAHELGHALSFYLFPSQPKWFSEGFAEWVETIASPRGDKVAQIGSHLAHGSAASYAAGMASPRIMNQLTNSTRIPSGELLAWDGRERVGERPWQFHIRSWLLYHYLWNRQSKGFADYQQRLMNGENRSTAWLHAFPQFDPSRPADMTKLDDELFRYVNNAAGSFLAVAATGKGDPAFAEVRALSSADVHALVAEIRLTPDEEAGRLAARRADWKEALAEDPLHPVSAFRFAANPEAALPVLKQAAAARPSDTRATALLGAALASKGDPAALPALQRAVALDDELLIAHRALAVALVRAGNAHDAVKLANRALDLAPWDPEATDALASVARALGKCPEAMALEQREAELMNDAKKGAAVLARVAEHDAACRKAASPATPAPVVTPSTPVGAPAK